MKQVEIIWAHPRSDSLTAAVVSNVKKQLEKQSWKVSQLDLYRNKFNPVLQAVDEPDWSDWTKTYSSDIMELIKELVDKDSVIFIFPVWWYSIPAIMKGYIDRVWNYGQGYGPKHTLRLQSILWIGLMGTTEANCSALGLNTSMENQLNVGIADYCDIKDSKTLILYETLAENGNYPPEHYANLLEQARLYTAEWAKARQ